MNSFESKARKKVKQTGLPATAAKQVGTEGSSILPGDIDAVVTQQCVDNTDKFSGSQDECAFALGFGCFAKLASIEPLQFRIVLPNMIRGLNEVIAQVSVAGMDQMSLFRLELADW